MQKAPKQYRVNDTITEVKVKTVELSNWGKKSKELVVITISLFKYLGNSFNLNHLLYCS